MLSNHMIHIILRATPSAAGPFWFLGLPFRRLGASILTFWETILSAGAHPGGPFWHLRTTLGDRGSSKMDSRWCFTGFYSILGWCWDLCILTFRVQEAYIFLFGLVSRPSFYRLLNQNFNVWDFQIEVFAWKVLQKLTSHGNRFL